MGDSTILQTFYDGTLKNECTVFIHFNKKRGTIEIHHKENTLCASLMRCGGNGMTAILCWRCCCPLFLFSGAATFLLKSITFSSRPKDETRTRKKKRGLLQSMCCELLLIHSNFHLGAHIILQGKLQALTKK